jgi:hypothetical protein
MSAPNIPPPAETAAREARSGGGTHEEPIRNPPGRRRTGQTADMEPVSRSGIGDLLEACLRMLKLTGGSQYWTGDTQAALEFMEAAVAAALEAGASQAPRTGTPAVIPEIVASVASSVDYGLQMAGVEADRG